MDEACYSRQAVLPHFIGYSRQRGSDIGSLASGAGRVALFAKVSTARSQINW